MPVIVLLKNSKYFLDDLKNMVKSEFDMEHIDCDFKTIRSKLTNMDSQKVYIVENCDLKPHRYEIYCLAKRNETSYCVISNTELTQSKQDVPLLNITNGLDKKALLECINNNLTCNAAHKKRIVCPNYVMRMKQIINRVNETMPKGSETVLRECEDKIMRISQINVIDLNDFEKSYNEIVKSELQNRGFL